MPEYIIVIVTVSHYTALLVIQSLPEQCSTCMQHIQPTEITKLHNTGQLF